MTQLSERTRIHCANPKSGPGSPLLGVVRSFQPGRTGQVEDTVSTMERLKISHLRMEISPPLLHTASGTEWYRWLLPKLAEHVSAHYYLRVSFKNHTQLCATVNILLRELDPFFPSLEFLVHADWGCMNGVDTTAHFQPLVHSLRQGAETLLSENKKPVLSGAPVATSPQFFKLALESGLLEPMAALGLTPPSPHSNGFKSWQDLTGRARSELLDHELWPELWAIPWETGPAPSKLRTIDGFLQALKAPVDRVYWNFASEGYRGAEDMPVPTRSLQEDFSIRLLSKGGVGALRTLHATVSNSRPKAGSPRKHVLITGGAGFIGTNLAARLAANGHRILLYDNLVRPGVEENLQWLLSTWGGNIAVELGDVRDRDRLSRAVGNACQIFHFASQVAVTTSIADPREDFEINALGTFNLLEAIRNQPSPPSLVFTSTNKVYGKLNTPLEESELRYVPADPSVRTRGISERQPLDFYSPYGCSKGAADQYVLDYSRIYTLPAVVLRMSCIYGPHQFGNEDQGWVAHFLLQAMNRQPLYIFGNGKQVRDILHVDDLVDALVLAQDRMQSIRGNAFNIGGGTAQTTSLLELLALMRLYNLVPSSLSFRNSRPGDQDYYVSDIGNFRMATGWNPKIGVRDGVSQLETWLRQHRIKSSEETAQAL